MTEQNRISYRESLLRQAERLASSYSSDPVTDAEMDADCKALRALATLVEELEQMSFEGGVVWGNPLRVLADIRAGFDPAAPLVHGPGDRS